MGERRRGGTEGERRYLRTKGAMNDIRQGTLTEEVEATRKRRKKGNHGPKPSLLLKAIAVYEGHCCVYEGRCCV